MSDVTLNDIAVIIREELKPIKEKLGILESNQTTIQQTLDSHTVALDTLAKSVKLLLD